MTARRILWGAWLLLAAALYLFENNAATLTVLCASLLLPLLSLLLSRAGSAAARIDLQDTCVRGDRVEGHITLSAPLFSPVRGELLCENRLTGERSTLTLAAGENTFTLDPGHCGAILLTCTARQEDLFGLRRTAPKVLCSALLTVLPELTDLAVTVEDTASPLSDSERYSLSRPGSDPAETFSLREYRPGDPIRQIHWKLSEKSGTTMIREPGMPITEEALLVFDNAAPALPHELDAMAELMLSLSRALLWQDIPHTAAWMEEGRFALAEIRTEPDFLRLRQAILCAGVQQDAQALPALLRGLSYAHTAVISASPLAGEAVTLLTPKDRAIPAIRL